jgi:hypothetical protein
LRHFHAIGHRILAKYLNDLGRLVQATRHAVAVKACEPAASATGGKLADAKLWAAFVISGVGK